MKRAFTVVALCLLSACYDPPVGPPREVEKIIQNISFEPAHEEKHCSKGCHYTAVPDTWYIQFCDIKNASDCFVRKITHAPWSWQKVGQRVKAQIQYYRSGDYWMLGGLLVDGREVAL